MSTNNPEATMTREEYESRLAAVCEKHGLAVTDIPEYLRPWLTALDQCIKKLPTSNATVSTAALYRQLLHTLGATDQVSAMRELARLHALDLAAQDAAATTEESSAVAPPPSADDAPGGERERFEAWAKGETIDVSRGPKTYKYPSARFSWAAWQARAAAPDAPRSGDAPVAFVPVHPRAGPLWPETYRAGDPAAAEARSPHYERMPLYTAPVSAPAQDPTIPESWLRFMRELSMCNTGMVSGRFIGMSARKLLASAPADARDPVAWQMRDDTGEWRDCSRQAFEHPGRHERRALYAAAATNADVVLVPREVAEIVRRAFLPTNPNKMRTAAPKTVWAAAVFIAATEAGHVS